ncbi:MAG TPA: ribosome silencing factor [Atribacterota bacterium]|nr:ribosome silencing factor [Atribacterota bacterium]
MIDNSQEIALYLAWVLEEKKAKDTIILDIKQISIIADYFIISTALSTAHLKTLITTLIEKIKENEINRNLSYEGNEYTGWVLLDCGDIVIHLFSEEKRNFYHLEQLWQDAKQIHFKI